MTSKQTQSKKAKWYLYKVKQTEKNMSFFSVCFVFLAAFRRLCKAPRPDTLLAFNDDGDGSVHFSFGKGLNPDVYVSLFPIES